MTDFEVQVEVQLTSNSPSDQQTSAGLQEVMSGVKESDWTGGLQNTGQEIKDSLLLLANVALLPPCGNDPSCSCDCEACSSCVEARRQEGGLQSLRLQLQFLLSKADHLHDSLINGREDSKALVGEVQHFLYTCQPYFNHLESTTRSILSPNTLLPFEIYPRLLDFSQQLCDKLEQLVLTYASYSLLCLDEAEPNSVSHFCIGQSQLGRLRLTAFRYCRPMPYLTRVHTGLYKRMRWNVERLRDNVQKQQANEGQGGEREEGKEETDREDTEYYFLCCEDVPHLQAKAAADIHDVSNGDVVRMWSIGQWVQVNPDPNTEDIYDWIVCEVPQATFTRLLFLGSDEPSSCSATDHLYRLLLSRQNTERC
uniref:UPF0575 protein C19orf67 homolog n=1 Tax=Semicossyphus pulcher TaxID=241346 RepID=UPI0037E734AE